VQLAPTDALKGWNGSTVPATTLLKKKTFFHFNEKLFSFFVKFFFSWETVVTQRSCGEGQGHPHKAIKSL
jgi:hypothetical protein